MTIFIKIIITLFLPLSVIGNETTIRMAKPESGLFSRNAHAEEVLRLALDKTIPSHGKYKIVYTNKMTRNRAMVEMQEGSIHVYDAPTRMEWEENLIPIYFPISKGLLSYRLLLIRKKDQAKFSKIRTSNELKQLRAGLGSQWSTTKVLEYHKFKVVKSVDYNGLFQMLASGRFDYFLRGANEIFGEFKNHQDELSNIAIEEDLVVYIYQPIYLFVTPKLPGLAKRVKAGLKMASEDGSFDRVFEKNHGENIKKSNLGKRRIINIINPLLKKDQTFVDGKYWIDPLEKSIL
jgi:hypothetical protein